MPPKPLESGDPPRLGRFELLGRLGFEGDTRPMDPERILTDLAAGRIGVDEAETLLAGTRTSSPEG